MLFKMIKTLRGNRLGEIDWSAKIGKGGVNLLYFCCVFGSTGFLEEIIENAPELLLALGRDFKVP